MFLIMQEIMQKGFNFKIFIYVKILNSLKPLKIGSFRILESRMNLLKHSTSSVSYIKSLNYWAIIYLLLGFQNQLSSISGTKWRR